MKKFKKVLNNIFYYATFALCCVVAFGMIVWKALICNFVDFVIRTSKNVYYDIKDIFEVIKEDRKKLNKNNSEETEE